MLLIVCHYADWYYVECCYAALLCWTSSITLSIIILIVCQFSECTVMLNMCNYTECMTCRVWISWMSLIVQSVVILNVWHFAERHAAECMSLCWVSLGWMPVLLLSVFILNIIARWLLNSIIYIEIGLIRFGNRSNIAFESFLIQNF
jgi:hypothetical protein